MRSPAFSFIDSFQRAVECHPFIQLFDTRLDIVGASLMNRHFDSGHIVLQAVTPVAAHKTMEDGRTYFFSPEENDYYIRICNNAVKKYETVVGKSADTVMLRSYGEFKKTVTKYKKTFITGYTGAFEINTSLQMAEFLYNTGLGEKNSQGFGFVNIMDK